MTTARSRGAATTARRIRRRRLRLPRDRASRRMAATLLLFALAFGSITARLVKIQVVAAEEYADRSVAQRSVTVELPARRGRLYDRDGAVLAASVDSATLYADPRAFRGRTTPDGLVVPAAGDAGEVAATLAPLLGLDAASLEERLTRDTHFVYVARQVDWELGQRVRDLGLPGIGVLTEPRRVYPGGALAAQLLGLTNIDGAGIEGLELVHDAALQGTAGRLAREAAPQGLTIAGGLREVEPPVPGTDLVLTLDREIQAVAEAAAARAVADFDAVGASVVVLEVATGDVLAMASAPGFDPTDRDATDLDGRRNRAVTDVFEPGSVQKAVTLAAALEEGLVAPSTVFEVDDRITIGPKTFRDAHDHPTEDMTVAQILETSSNVGTMQIAQLLGDDRLHEYLVRFGYGRPTGIAFPGEVAGILMPAENWWVTSLPTIAIGQGVAVTLLQAAGVYATIANDGVAMTPSLVRGTVGTDGRLTPRELGSGTRVVSAETARSVREMLVDVIDGDGGTGRRASVPGYSVAGKTGTAQKPDGPNGYSDQYIATFVGLAPASDPELVVAVMVDEPYPIYGGVVAAPVFAEVMEFALRARSVAPDRPTTSLTDALRAAADALARQEGPASAGTPASPPVGARAGGDGTTVAGGSTLAE